MDNILLYVPTPKTPIRSTTTTRDNRCDDVTPIHPSSQYAT